MTLHRRDLLRSGLPLLAAPLIAPWSTPARAATAARAPAATPASVLAALANTDLVYLSPVKRDGRDSRCQAEVWFTHQDKRLWVVTATPSWRNRALDRGLRRTRVWVGDVGQWKDAGGKHRQLPVTLATARRIADRTEQQRVLGLFGEKYTAEWLLWGPRFRNGLADGSRVLLQYDLS